MILLTTDWHLDDQPHNEYRWRIFEHIRSALDRYVISHVYALGDIWDRKDRFASPFVNRLIVEIEALGSIVPLTILRGNHDTPLNGPAFFQFVNGMVEGVRYVTEPTADGRIILLPFTPAPLDDWGKIRFADFACAMMHVTVTGAMSENGFALTGSKVPTFPKGMRLYSGDVHQPQTIERLNLTYVGCPHPIKFGDDFPCRMLVLDEATFDIVAEVPVEALRKRVVEVNSIEQLRSVVAARGDQARVRYNLSADEVDRLGEIEAALAEWSDLSGVDIASTEFVVEHGRGSAEVDIDVAPETILRQFAEGEALTEDLVDVGLKLLREV